MRKLTIELPPRLMKALRLAAVNEDITIRALVTRLIERHVGQKGSQPPISDTSPTGSRDPRRGLRKF